MKTHNKVLMGLLAVVLVFTATIGTIGAQTDFFSQWLRANSRAASDGVSMLVELSGSTEDFDVGGDLTVTGSTDFSAWNNYKIVNTTAQSYSLASAGKASIVEVSHTTTGAATVHLMTDLLTSPGAGGVFHVIDKDGNASSNNIVIDTEGSETINGAASLTLNADYEAATIYTDGTNFFRLGGNLE